MYANHEVQYLTNDASKLQKFDEKSVKLLIVWHRLKLSDILVIAIRCMRMKCNISDPNAIKLHTFHVKSVKLWMHGLA